MRNRARLLVLLTAAASVVVLGLTIAASRHANVVTVALAFVAFWAASISVADTMLLWPSPKTQPPRPDRPTALTFVMSLGEERDDIARTSILLAAKAGHVHIVSTKHHDLLAELGDALVTEHVAPTIQEAVHAAARTITTDAVLFLSASAFPIGVSCGAAASQLGAGVGWVTGSVAVFNHDRYSPRERDALSARVRSAARRFGLVTWEPDATIVRTSLLREHPFDPTRPYGHWLRARWAEGYRGVVHPEPVAVQAAPSDAPVFWPTRTSRQRGAVADLADAMTAGPFHSRAVAAAVILRELFAVPILLWLAAIVLIGRSGDFPLRIAPIAFFAIQGGLSVARWASSRWAYGIGVHPVDETRAGRMTSRDRCSRFLRR